MEKRITELEIKIAYLEDFLNKLQAIAVEQGEVVDTLKAENRVLKAKIKEILDNQEQDIPNRRPPHYWFQLWKAGKLLRGEKTLFFDEKGKLLRVSQFVLVHPSFLKGRPKTLPVSGLWAEKFILGISIDSSRVWDWWSGTTLQRAMFGLRVLYKKSWFSEIIQKSAFCVFIEITLLFYYKM